MNETTPQQGGHALYPVGDCWCEPQIVVTYDEDKTPWFVVKHQKLVRPRIILADWVFHTLNSVQLAPEEGWDVVMSRESVDKLLKSVHDLPRGLPIEAGNELKQRENETVGGYV